MYLGLFRALLHFCFDSMTIEKQFYLTNEVLFSYILFKILIKKEIKIHLSRVRWICATGEVVTFISRFVF